MENDKITFKEPKESSVRRIIPRTLLCVLTGLLAGIGALVVSGIHWMFSIWFGDVEELVYTMTNLAGAGSGMITQFLIKCGTVTIAAIAAYILLTVFVFRKGKHYVLHIWNVFVCVISLLAILSNFIMAWNDLGISEYLENQRLYEEEMAMSEAEDADTEDLISGAPEAKKQAFIDEQYVNPVDVKITAPEKKRNLILIYLESMENTYADKANGGAYDINYIPELTALSEQNENFSGTDNTLNGGEVLTYSTWTMGAIFAHSAGLPLNLPIGRNQMDSQEEFLPSVTTLGDILEDNGYNQAFMCGSEAEFGGRKAYFTTHGNFQFLDQKAAWESGELPYGYDNGFWGVEDSLLIEMAQNHLTEMAAQDKPFNFTFLTVDTHYPDGYMCDLCTRDLNMRTSDGYNNQYGNVLACSSRQVTQFIDWIKQQNFYKDTTIVVLGDHLTMDHHFCCDVPDDYTRTTYTTYINSAVEPESKEFRHYVTEDSFPTILASLGFEIEGDRLGLGVNLFSDEPTLLEEYGYEYLDKEISKKSNLLTEISNEVSLDAAVEEGYKVHNCDVTVPLIDTVGNYMTVVINDVYSSSGISKLTLKAYTYEDMSDAVWLTPEPQEDGTYRIDIELNTFAHNPNGECTLITYCFDQNWIRYYMNETTVKLQTPQDPVIETTPSENI